MLESPYCKKIRVFFHQLRMHSAITENQQLSHLRVYLSCAKECLELAVQGQHSDPTISSNIQFPFLLSSLLSLAYCPIPCLSAHDHTWCDYSSSKHCVLIPRRVKKRNRREAGGVAYITRKPGFPRTPQLPSL